MNMLLRKQRGKTTSTEIDVKRIQMYDEVILYTNGRGAGRVCWTELTECTKMKNKYND